ncbi:methyltransferase family protein [Prosthecobacter sp.]|jgi:protein-S-isoprenylcysteine O-methyltransferase Ste14|uniref:methyltransferase family protein n=1 Tax=Prosthecobacter sp. TaxID=1965333 RepID=UPI0037CB3619
MKSAALKDLTWVTVQLVLLAALLMMPAFGLLPFVVPLRPLGWLLCIAGPALSGVASWQLHAGRSLTPMPSPRRGAALLVDGMYRRVRHPVYSGLLIWALGIAIAAASILHFVLFGMLWVFFNAKAAHEERLLALQFSNYPEYAARTPRFFPSRIQSR